MASCRHLGSSPWAGAGPVLHILRTHAAGSSSVCTCTITLAFDVARHLAALQCPLSSQLALMMRHTRATAAPCAALSASGSSAACCSRPPRRSAFVSERAVMQRMRSPRAGTCMTSVMESHCTVPHDFWQLGALHRQSARIMHTHGTERACKHRAPSIKRPRAP